jgi:hypothetical protein
LYALATVIVAAVAMMLLVVQHYNLSRGTRSDATH